MRLNGENALAVWTRASSSTATIYEVHLFPDGTVSCNCPGWVFQRKCKHVREITRDLGSDRSLHNALRCGGKDVQALRNAATSSRPLAATVERTAGPQKVRAVRFDDE